MADLRARADGAAPAPKIVTGPGVAVDADGLEILRRTDIPDSVPAAGEADDLPATRLGRDGGEIARSWQASATVCRVARLGVNFPAPIRRRQGAVSKCARRAADLRGREPAGRPQRAGQRHQDILGRGEDLRHAVAVPIERAVRCRSREEPVEGRSRVWCRHKRLADPRVWADTYRVLVPCLTLPHTTVTAGAAGDPDTEPAVGDAVAVVVSRPARTAR